MLELANWDRDAWFQSCRLPGYTSSHSEQVLLEDKNL